MSVPEPKLLLTAPPAMQAPSAPYPTVSDSFAIALAGAVSTILAGAPPGNNLAVNPLQLTSPSAMSTPLDNFTNSDCGIDNQGPVDAGCGSESSLDSSKPLLPPPLPLQAPSSLCPIVSDSFANGLATSVNTAFAGAPSPAVNALWLTLPSATSTPLDNFTNGLRDVDNRSPVDAGVFDGPDLLQPRGSYSDDGQSDGSEGNSDSSSESASSSGDMDVDDVAPKKSAQPPGSVRKPKTSANRRSAGTAKTISDGDSLVPTNPTKSSASGNLAKRRRSSSPAVLRGLGTKENPIELDRVASLFDPVAIREFVKKEQISLSLEASPLIDRDETYTVFDVIGQPVSFIPKFHFPVYHNRFHQFMDRVEMLYDNGQPLHIAQLKERNVVVTRWPLEDNISFNEAGLRKVAGTPSRQISINDYSIKPSSNKCRPTVVSGRVRDLWENRHPSGKILNALDLLLYDGKAEPNEYASDLHAWDVTRGHHHIDPV
ncbi:hypothetical protein K443DRAFT_11213, partial [Laccaria amethystina LaAM-08-1]